MQFLHNFLNKYIKSTDIPKISYKWFVPPLGVRVFFLVFFLVIFLLKIFTLSRNPLAWFDEVMFASISQSFWQNGDFKAPIAIFDQEEVRIYGFFYFLYAGFLPYIFQDVLGFAHSPFYFRMGNMLAGCVFLYLFYRIIRIFLHFPKKYSLFLTAVLSIDPFFNLCWHEGRMDITSISFGYLFLIFLEKNNKNQEKGDYEEISHKAQTTKHLFLNFKYQILCVLCIVCALWTTPRIALVLVGFGLIGFLLDFPKRIFWVKTAFFAVIFYSFWIFWKFKSVVDFVLYYQNGGNLAHESSFQEHYLGGRGYIPKHEYLIILLTFLYAVISPLTMNLQRGSKSKGRINIKNVFSFKIFNNQKAFLLLGCALNIILFYMFVFDYGQYSIYILGFYYILFGYFLKNFNFKWYLSVAPPLGAGRLPLGLLGGLLLLSFNLFFFLGKNLQIFSDYTRKNPQIANDFIAKNLPKNAHLIGDATYYYALTNAKIAFQLMDNYDTMENRELSQRQKFQYSHIIITEMLRKKRPELLDYYEKKAKASGYYWKKIATLQQNPPQTYIYISNFFRLSQMENPAYNAEIFILEKINKN